MRDAFTESRRRTARELFANCPRSYQGTYLEGVSSEPDATRRGNVFHDARAKYISALFAAQSSADHELADMAWHSAITNAQLPAAEYADARHLWLAWTERFDLNIKTFYAAEQEQWCGPFSCWLRFDEVHATADTLTIVDAKTHWRLPTPDALRSSVQTGVYAAGARLVFPGFQRYVLVYDYVRVNQQITVCLSDAELDDWCRWVQENDEALDIAELTNAYPAKGGAHCGYCRVKCDLADHVSAMPIRFLSADEAKAAVSRMAARDAANKADMAALKTYADQHGAVVEGGIEWTYRKMIKATYDAVGIVNAMKHNEIAVPLALSATAIKPLHRYMKANPTMREIVESCKSEKVSTQFSKAVATTDDTPTETDE